MKKREEIIIAQLFKNIAMFFLGCILLKGFVSRFPEEMSLFSVSQVIIVLSWGVFCISKGFLDITKK